MTEDMLKQNYDKINQFLTLWSGERLPTMLELKDIDNVAPNDQIDKKVAEAEDKAKEKEKKKKDKKKGGKKGKKGKKGGPEDEFM